MKHLLMVLLSSLLLTLTFSLRPSAAQAQGGVARASEPFAGQALCLPGVYLTEPGDCLALGPSAFLTDMARLGLTFPLRPLPAAKPDASLSQMTDQYLKVNSKGDIPIYGSLEAARSHSVSRYLAGSQGLKYLAILQRVDEPGGVYFQLLSGEWVNGGEAQTACCITSGRFQGLVFSKTPPNAFGWVLSPVKTYRLPGYQSEETGRELNREDLVQVYAMQEKDQANWLMIGVDEWVDDQYVGRVTPNLTPPQGVTNDRWIEVNLAEQTLSVYDHGQLVFATLIATGVKPFYTRPGLFQIYEKKPLETMRGAFEADKSDFYYLENVPWTMYFDKARALHGAYWRTLYGYPASHGCVNLSPGDSHWLFDWANQGDWVYVWDPSGQTPTDPAYYGDGGA
ncbi:MAG: L,D-transpeptidase [Chloroflexi bacterium]|nr:L,D-transpeptidase [Chloroflexota bacterium]